VLGSAIGMDKDVMKRLLKEGGIKIGKFIAIRSTDNIPTFETVKKTLKSPFFVKPANLGSSIGISKVKSKAGYKIALRKAFYYDSKIIIEENIKGREIECAVLGNNKDNIIASIPGEIINSKHTFYDYQAKYKENEGVILKIPAKLTSVQQETVKKIAIQAYTVLECTGFARVDIFLRNNEIIINEINTIPGFTNYSMYPKMFEASGITQEELVAKLVNLALETK
jgi:D-alanine-D-alanine ligase